MDKTEKVFGKFGHILWQLFSIELPQRHFEYVHKQGRHFVMNRHRSRILQLWEVKMLLHLHKICEQKPHNVVSCKHFCKCSFYWLCIIDDPFILTGKTIIQYSFDKIQIWNISSRANWKLCLKNYWYNATCVYFYNNFFISVICSSRMSLKCLVSNTINIMLHV